MQSEPEPTTTESPIEEEKENVDPANRLSPDRAVLPPSEEEEEEGLTPSDEMVQKVEIKIEDPEELREASTDGEEEMAGKDAIENEVMLRYKYSEGEENYLLLLALMRSDSFSMFRRKSLFFCCMHCNNWRCPG